MSDLTNTSPVLHNPRADYAEDAELTRIETLYRDAYASTGPGREVAIATAINEIRKSRGDYADDYIAGLDRVLEHERDIDSLRLDLARHLDAADHALDGIKQTIARADSPQVYDSDIADSDTAAMAAALTGARLNLAALRHLTRNAKPEPRP